jgi:hypothetical protein
MLWSWSVSPPLTKARALACADAKSPQSRRATVQRQHEGHFKNAKRRQSSKGQVSDVLSESVTKQRKQDVKSAVKLARASAAKRDAFVRTVQGVPVPPKPRGTFADAMEIAQQSAMPAGNRRGRGRGRTKGAVSFLLNLHKQHFLAALDAELEEEWRESELRLQRSAHVLQV